MAIALVKGLERALGLAVAGATTYYRSVKLMLSGYVL
jgi:hypothetical protein